MQHDEYIYNSYLCTKGYKGVSVVHEGRCFENEMIARGPSEARPESYHLIWNIARGVYEDAFVAHGA